MNEKTLRREAKRSTWTHATIHLVVLIPHFPSLSACFHSYVSHSRAHLVHIRVDNITSTMKYDGYNCSSM